MSKNLRDLIILATLTIFLTFLIWTPHFFGFKSFWGLNFSNGFETIYRNYDGLEYIIIAKSFYIPSLIAQLQDTLTPAYYASHFPGYSILIFIFAPILGFLKSMLFVSVISTILAVWAFYYLVKDFKLTDNPLLLSSIFIFLPARWVVVHSVGSSEPLFIFLTIASIYFFLKYEQGKFIFLRLKNPIKVNKYLTFSVIFATLAQITRPPGILLFIALVFYVNFKMFKSIKKEGFIRSYINHLNYFPLLLIPLSLLGIFAYFGFSYNDFWAYFHSGDNIHLTFPPFQVFNKYQAWVGDIWLEDIVFIFILGFLGGITLFKKKLYILSFFVFTYLGASTLIAHRDISRYILPVAPFILIAFEKVLISKEFKIILPIILTAIYLYAQNFILANTAPISNLSLFN